MECRCNKCGYVWDYRGKSQYYTSCPRCRSNVKIKPNNTGGDASDNNRHA